MHLYCFQRVSTTRRVEPASRSEERADEPPVEGQEPHEQPASRRKSTDIASRSATHWTTPPCRRSNAPITRSRSAARSAWQAVAAPGAARTTSRLPPGSNPKYPRARCRRRRRTVFLTTAEPTALLTIKPTRAGSGLPPGRTSRWPDTSWRPALLPLRVASPKSVLRRIRAAAGSMVRSRTRPRHTLTRARPFRRRAPRIARPARVRMRSRKP
jgi:hypothetical protein